MLIYRRTIHLPMRDLISCIVALHKQAVAEGNEINVGSTQMSSKTAEKLTGNKHNKSSQTSPAIRSNHEATAKRSREPEAISVRLPDPKRTRSTPVRDPNCSQKKNSCLERENEKENEVNSEKWQTVTNKRSLGSGKPQNNMKIQQNKRRNRAVRPDAILIKKTGEISYADMLKIMKQDPKLKELGESINKIRRTERGELLLELTGKANNITDKLSKDAKTVLQDIADIKTLSHEIVIECRDIDEVTTASEICEAIEGQYQMTARLEKTP